MVFGQLLKNVLDKHQEVWIPTIGLLGYDKATSKLNLDVYGSGTDKDLVSLIADIKRVSQGEAKGILIQEVEAIKNAIRSEGKYTLEGLGEISMQNGSFQFETKKALFPTNFFGTSNFNPAAFQNNAPKKVEEIPVRKNVFEDNFIKVEPKGKVEEPIAKTIELDNNTTPEIEEVPKDLFEAAKPKIEKAKIEKPIVVEEEKIIEETIVPPVPVEPEIEIKNEEPQDLVQEPIVELAPSQIEDEIVEDEYRSHHIEEEIEDEIEEEEIVVEETPKIVIDEPRRNIGRAAYDEGYYDYNLSTSSSADNNGKWKTVGLAALGLLALAFFIPWLWASYKGENYLGMNPLWDSKKQEKKIEKPLVAVKTDTTAVDSAAILAAVKTDTAASAPTTATTTPPPTNNNKTASAIATTSTKTTNSTPIQTNKNTSPKTPNPTVIDSKKSVAVATKNEKKSTEVSTSVGAVSSAAKTNAKDTTQKQLAKKTDVKVVGKPYATANYTKGNYYLSFGKFKVPTAASKLRQDMKKKAGVETDIILVDGMYRVVIPYLSKDKAEAAARDYVSTTLFE